MLDGVKNFQSACDTAEVSKCSVDCILPEMLYPALLHWIFPETLTSVVVLTRKKNRELLCFSEDDMWMNSFNNMVIWWRWLRNISSTCIKSCDLKNEIIGWLHHFHFGCMISTSYSKQGLSSSELLQRFFKLCTGTPENSSLLPSRE